MTTREQQMEHLEALYKAIESIADFKVINRHGHAYNIQISSDMDGSIMAFTGAEVIYCSPMWNVYTAEESFKTPHVINLQWDTDDSGNIQMQEFPVEFTLTDVEKDKQIWLEAMNTWLSSHIL